MSDIDCRKCRVGKFKNALCSNDICKTFGAVGNEEDFIRLFTRPRGEWINTAPSDRSDNIICDQCGYNSIARYDYCPHCGADMRGNND